MSKLNIDQKSIKDLFQQAKSEFLIPDYQRPYAWGEKECQTLWDDIYDFSFPDNDFTKFKEGEEYYLGPIVTFRNGEGKLEVIDGQQRLTTLMLLLRAFFTKSSKMGDPNSRMISAGLEKCIWKSDMFGGINRDMLKIDSLVATDNDKEEFLEILRTGEVKLQQDSIYARNYRFFESKIQNFITNTPTYFPYLPAHILNDCILLPIEAESQDTALRIFSTLNDRGKPLSDADIFKAQFYSYYKENDQKDTFIKNWKMLEEVCEKAFPGVVSSPVDEVFTRYMYYLRAKAGNKSSTTAALRKFYEKDKYALIRNNEALEDLMDLAYFWLSIGSQDAGRFSKETLRQLFILHYAPNGMWTYFVSVYFLKNRRNVEGEYRDELDDAKFFVFLKKLVAFIWAYTLTNPGVNALRTPIYAEMVKLMNEGRIDYAEFKFDELHLRSVFDNYQFTNQRPLTRSMMAWWMMQCPNQDIPHIDTVFEIEHIFARKRQELENSLLDIKNLESLGNKAMLERNINIRAADYKFFDKKKYYQGFQSGHGYKDGTKNSELKEIASNKNDFSEDDIKNRYQKIQDKFIEYLRENDLLK